jgi:DNA invertase Pin-like site-specific DNA recombinase
LGAVAEFERALILERQREGIALAKAAGKYKGRKPTLSADIILEIRQRSAAGEKKGIHPGNPILQFAFEVC